MPEHFDPFLSLADEIRERFTPAVFSCSCQGSERSCARALEDPAIWAQRDTVERIARHIETNHQLKELPHVTDQA